MYTAELADGIWTVVKRDAAGSVLESWPYETEAKARRGVYNKRYWDEKKLRPAIHLALDVSHMRPSLIAAIRDEYLAMKSDFGERAIQAECNRVLDELSHLDGWEPAPEQAAAA